MIGASSDLGMEPTATNLETGQRDPTGEVIRPEHILQTLVYDAGLLEEGSDPADYRVDPVMAILQNE